jgi:hypothetical protein
LISWLPKLSEDGAGVAVGRAPVPVRVTACGDPEESSETESEAEREPVVVGVNVTVTEQAEEAFSVPEQVFVWEKSPVFEPVKPMELMVSVALPVLVSVAVCVADAAATLTVPNAIEAGTSETAGAVRL